ncbi:hypothetical protein GCM10023322_56430 [Rugosimonospora acidiphila]|uniref:Uncharacterized protein n=1 Tax=Rugosimonospora acidiphila TaxID=556531 RepID=A0ABP9SBA0_9ACTN
MVAIPGSTTAGPPVAARWVDPAAVMLIDDDIDKFEGYRPRVQAVNSLPPPPRVAPAARSRPCAGGLGDPEIEAVTCAMIARIAGRRSAGAPEKH